MGLSSISCGPMHTLCLNTASAVLAPHRKDLRRQNRHATFRKLKPILHTHVGAADLRVATSAAGPAHLKRSEVDAADALLRGLEKLCLASAVASQLLIAYQARHHAATHRASGQQQQQQQQMPTIEVGSGSRWADSMIAPLAAPCWTPWALIVSVACGSLLRWRDKKRDPLVGLRVSSGASAKLVQLDALVAQQAGELGVLTKQVGKLQTRVRLAGRDYRLPIKQLQQNSAEQAALLVQLTQQAERMGREVVDTQELLADLQGVSAKQFMVLVDAIKQLQKRHSEAVLQQAPRPTPLPSATGHAAQADATASTNKAASGAQPSAAAAAPAAPKAAAPPSKAAAAAAAGRPDPWRSSPGAGGSASPKPSPGAGGSASPKPSAGAGGSASPKPSPAAGRSASPKPSSAAGRSASLRPSAAAGGSASPKSSPAASGSASPSTTAGVATGGAPQQPRLRSSITLDMSDGGKREKETGEPAAGFAKPSGVPGGAKSAAAQGQQPLQQQQQQSLAPEWAARAQGGSGVPLDFGALPSSVEAAWCALANPGSHAGQQQQQQHPGGGGSSTAAAGAETGASGNGSTAEPQGVEPSRSAAPGPHGSNGSGVTLDQGMQQQQGKTTSNEAAADKDGPMPAAHVCDFASDLQACIDNAMDEGPGYIKAPGAGQPSAKAAAAKQPANVDVLSEPLSAPACDFASDLQACIDNAMDKGPGSAAAPGPGQPSAQAAAAKQPADVDAPPEPLSAPVCDFASDLQACIDSSSAETPGPGQPSAQAAAAKQPADVDAPPEPLSAPVCDFASDLQACIGSAMDEGPSSAEAPGTGQPSAQAAAVQEPADVGAPSEPSTGSSSDAAAGEPEGGSPPLKRSRTLSDDGTITFHF